MPAFDPRDLQALEDALWTALGSDRAPGERRALVSRLLASPEFQKLRAAWNDRARAGSRTKANDAVTPDLNVGPAPTADLKVGGDDAGFVNVAYECLLS